MTTNPESPEIESNQLVLNGFFTDSAQSLHIVLNTNLMLPLKML